MGPHNLLFWMSLAAVALGLCLVAVLKVARGPAPEDSHIADRQDRPSPP